jgi:hypothetical protein
MNSVPPETRGVSSGMRATFQNSAAVFSIGVFFSIVSAGLAAALPSTLFNGLTKHGVPSAAATQIAHLPPTAALFGAFLGYNPIGVLLPPSILNHLSAANRATLLGKSFFPNLISGPFMVGLSAVFYIAALMCLVAAVASLLRGRRYIHGAEPATAGVAAGAAAGALVRARVAAANGAANGHNGHAPAHGATAMHHGRRKSRRARSGTAR